jgi:hypothetical protein
VTDETSRASARREAITRVMQDVARAPLEGARTFSDEDVRARLERADEALREEPWLAPALTVHAAPWLGGLVELRLSLAHTSLDPLEVGAPEADLAAALVTRIAHLVSATGSAHAHDLGLRTIEALHPAPGSTTRTDLGALVHDWETVRDVPQTSAEWWAQKRVQNVRFFRAIFFAPLYGARIRRIRRRLPARLRANADVMETYRALEQLGPVLDNFVFDLGPRALFADRTALADFAFLYMQLADELVDNLVKLGGLDAVRTLVGRIYAPRDRQRLFIPLEDLDAAHLRSVGIDPEASIPKYRTTVIGLVLVLRALHAVLREILHECRDVAVIEKRTSDFFHHCFATFLDELELPTRAGGVPLDQLPLADVAWHFYRKNNLVMSRWLALRAALLGLRPEAYASALSTWGYVLATFQVFDDMKDLALDLGHQPSYALELAWTRHRDEHAFLDTTYGSQPLAIDRNDVPRLMLGMPRTMRDAMRISRVMALGFLEWFTHYVFDYRWRRNWLVRARSFHLAPAKGDVPVEALVDARLVRTITTDVPVIDATFRVIAQTASLANEHALDDEYFAFVLDVVGYDHGLAITRAALPNVRTAYRFLNLRMRMASSEKACLLVRLCTRHRGAATQALAQLRWATGSSSLAFALARRLGIELTQFGRPAVEAEA